MQSYPWIGPGGVLRAMEDRRRFLHRRVAFSRVSFDVDLSARAGVIRSPRGAVVDTCFYLSIYVSREGELAAEKSIT